MSDSLVTLWEVDPDEKTKRLILAGKLPLFVKFELGTQGHRFIDTQDSGGQKNSIDRLRRIRKGTATKAEEEIDEYIINSSTRNAKHDPERGIMVSQSPASEPSYYSENLTDVAPYSIDFERSKKSTLQKIMDNRAEAARGYLTVSRGNIDWFVPILPEGTDSGGVSGECLQLMVDKNDLENITTEKQPETTKEAPQQNSAERQAPSPKIDIDKIPRKDLLQLEIIKVVKDGMPAKTIQVWDVLRGKAAKNGGYAYGNDDEREEGTASALKRPSEKPVKHESCLISAGEDNRGPFILWRSGKNKFKKLRKGNLEKRLARLKPLIRVSDDHHQP